MGQTIFKAEEFEPSKYKTAQEKADFANRLVRFIDSGFEKRFFTKKLYNDLYINFSMIAHYNHHGFWDYYFEGSGEKLDFTQDLLNAKAYGDPTHTNSDVEKAVQQWMYKNRILDREIYNHESVMETAELTEYKRLQQKYGTIKNYDLEI
jgi:hypothetical protein